MSRNNTGTYALPTGNPVQFGTLISPIWANSTLNDIATALSDSLSRSGKGGMTAPLNMGGFKVMGAAGATLSSDLPTALQVRSGTFTWLFPVSSDASGNAYTGTSPLPDAPVAGTVFFFMANATNTGPMTLSVNGGAALPLLINGLPVVADSIVSGVCVQVVLFADAYRVIGVSTAPDAAVTITSGDEDTLDVTSVDNDFTITPKTNVPNGLIKLSPTAQVPVPYWPISPMIFAGAWDAATNSPPPITTGTGTVRVATTAGTVNLYQCLTANAVYIIHAVSVNVGDFAIFKAEAAPNYPAGWYYVASSGITSAAAVSCVATSLFPSAVDVQAWLDAADTYISDLLPLSGGTITGEVFYNVVPSDPTSLVNRQYVQDQIGAINTGILSFNGRTAAAAVMVSADVTTALGYTPANVGGDDFTGPISAPVMGAAAFVPLAKIANIAGVQALDFLEAQSQILTLTATASISAINNFPVGSLMRITLLATDLVLTSWPAAVVWPGTGSPPDLTTGTEKKAVVVLENDGTNYLAAASVY